MALQEIVWTAMPAGTVAGTLGLSRRLKLSVLVSPRLGTDEVGADPAAPLPVLRLSQFADFRDWPATLTSTERPLVFSVQFEGGPSVEARRVVRKGFEPSSQLWRSLFRDDTRVVPFTFPDFSKAGVASDPVPTASDALKGLWVLTASRSGATLPTVADMDQILADAGVRGGEGPSQGMPPPVPRPEEGPRPGAEPDEESRALLEIGIDVKVGIGGGVLGGGLGIDIGGVVNVGGWREPPSGQEGEHRGPPAGAAIKGVPTLSKAGVEGSLREVAGAHVPPPGSPTAPPTGKQLEEIVDFHRVLSLLSQHPDLLRRLGLVIDLEVPLHPGIASDGDGSVQQVRVVPVLKPGAPTQHYSPATVYTLDRDRFLAAPRANGSFLRNGLLRLDDGERFRVEQLDVDGASRKVRHLADTVTRLAARLGAGHGLGTPEEVGLPTLRSGGICVLHEDVAGSNDAPRNTAQDVVSAAIGEMASLNEQLEASKQGGGGAAKIGPLFAEHLTAGYRLDVWDDRSDRWHSLCQRSATYRFLDAPAAGTEVSVPPQAEGLIERSTTGSASTGLSVAASVFSWEGWSLCAPRPGLVLDTEGGLSEEKNEPEATPFRLQIQTKAAPGSLPRLRFGRWYRLRARAVDLAGNSLALGDPPKDTPEAGGALRYARLEPVPSPVVVLRALPSEGESVERLVVRSDPAVTGGAAETADRHIAPPKCSQLLAEAQGGFDVKGGMRADRAGYDLAARERGSLEDGHPPVSTAAGTYVLRPEERLDVPYLPDPLAHAALLVGLPGVAADAFQPNVNVIPFTGGWPNRSSFRLAVTGIAADKVPGAPKLTEGSGRRILNVQLPAGQTREVLLSSYLDPGPKLVRLGLMAVWRWIEAAEPPNLEQLRLDTARGRNWLLMPYRKVVLVHAVKRPLRPPVMPPDQLVVEREPGDTFVSVSGTMEAEASSTSKVDVHASWTDRVDDLGPSGFVDVTREAHVGVVGEPEAVESFRFRHELGDTRRHAVRYRAEATTSFREYFPNVDASGKPLGSAEFVRPAPGEPPVLTAPIDIPASARPAAPVVHAVLPTFAWHRSSAPDENVVYKSVRRGRGVRIWLDRPWYSSGQGEMLGVVFVERPPAEDDPLRSLVTLWGPDPLWSGPPTDARLTEANFPGATVEHGLTLEELPAENPGEPARRPRVSVAAYTPTFDAKRNRWFCDIEMRFQTEETLDLFTWPFVRLALVRYQPVAIRRDDGTDVKLSRVVLTDFVQLAQDRTLTLTSAESEDGAVRRDVEVRGVLPMRLDPNGEPTQMKVTVLTRRWQGSDLGWAVEANALRELEVSGVDRGTGMTTWAGALSFPADGVERRLLVKELEAVAPALVIQSVDPAVVMEMLEASEQRTVTLRGGGFRSPISLSIQDVEVRSHAVKGGNEIEAVVHVPLNTPPGTREIVATNPDRRTARAALELVAVPPPEIFGWSPGEFKKTVTEADPNPVFRLTVKGRHFRNGATITLEPGTNLEIGKTVFDSEAQLHCDVTVIVSASVKDFHIIVVTNPVKGVDTTREGNILQGVDVDVRRESVP